MLYYSNFVLRASGLNALLRVPRPLRGLLLYLRKAFSPLTLAKMVVCIVLEPLFVATGVVRPPQRSKGGDRAAGGGHERRWARRDRCGLSTRVQINFEFQNIHIF
jgi:hypothetical protein